MSEPADMTPRGHDLPARGGNGRWRRGIESVERDAEACRMYVAGKTYLEISEALGYGGKQNAHTAVQRVLMDTMTAPADEVRALLKARHEEIYVLARDIALSRHKAHSHGRVVYDGEEPVYDDTPRMAAMDRMTRALDQLAKLTGAYAPVKFENLSLEAIQAEIARIEAEIADDPT